MEKIKAVIMFIIKYLKIGDLNLLEIVKKVPNVIKYLPNQSD